MTYIYKKPEFDKDAALQKFMKENPTYRQCTLTNIRHRIYREQRKAIRLKLTEQVCHLYYENGKTQEEIGRILKKSASSVNYILRMSSKNIKK